MSLETSKPQSLQVGCQAIEEKAKKEEREKREERKGKRERGGGKGDEIEVVVMYVLCRYTGRVCLLPVCSLTWARLLSALLFILLD